MEDSSSYNVDQSHAQAGEDNVGRDKHVHNHFQERRSQIDGWLEKLAEEMRGSKQVRDLVDNLQYYFQALPYDDVIGLEAKLDHAGRSNQKSTAFRKKEAFSKLLAQWQAFPAGQEIIAYFLAKIEGAFETRIAPGLANTAPEDIDALIHDCLVVPVLDEMGCGPFVLNNTNVYGMVYWLAEQCYVRWHT